MKKLLFAFSLGLILISCENNKDKEKYLPYYELIGKPISEVLKVEKRDLRQETEYEKTYTINTSNNYISYNTFSLESKDTITYIEISLNKKSGSYSDIIKNINKEFKNRYKHQSFGNICDIYTTSDYKYAGIYLKYYPDDPNAETFTIYKMDDKKIKSFKANLESHTEFELSEFVEKKYRFNVVLSDTKLYVYSEKYEIYSDKGTRKIMGHDYDNSTAAFPQSRYDIVAYKNQDMPTFSRKSGTIINEPDYIRIYNPQGERVMDFSIDNIKKNNEGEITYTGFDNVLEERLVIIVKEDKQKNLIYWHISYKDGWSEFKTKNRIF